MAITGNKGEWSEFYTLVYLLSTGKLFAADENLKKMVKMYFPIKKIFRNEDKRNKIVYNLTHGGDSVALFLNGEFIGSISQNYLSAKAIDFLKQIKAGKGDGAFTISNADELMNALHCSKIKASSADKTDIQMEIYDIQTGYTTKNGFSIKSELGGDPTLLNASKATNFVYQIENFSSTDMAAVNAIDSKEKILDRVKKIRLLGGKLKFKNTSNAVFSRNLYFFDSNMACIISEMLLDYYENGVNKLSLLAKNLEERNPLNIPTKNFYSYKLKKFLCAIALGLKPSKEWDGKDEANGGYIIVTTAGEVLAYHIYNRDSFESYLLNNTRLERGSTSKHHFACVYQEGSDFLFNLNLQVRFK